jgi:hypothetical protein
MVFIIPEDAARSETIVPTLIPFVPGVGGLILFGLLATVTEWVKKCRSSTGTTPIAIIWLDTE